MTNKIKTPFQIDSPHKHLLVSLSLLSKNLLESESEPVISGISFPLVKSFTELVWIMENDNKFKEKFDLFTINNINLFNVVEQYPTENQIEKIYAENDNLLSPVIITITTISYLDLLSNYKIVELLYTNNATENNQQLFFFENCTWQNLKNKFSLNKIALTVGSNTRRQFLSPIEYKFSLILMCLGLSLEEIGITFLKYEQYNKQQNDLTKQEVKNKTKTNRRNQKKFIKPSFQIKEFTTSLSRYNKNYENITVKGERKREIDLIKTQLKLNKTPNIEPLTNNSVILSFLEDLGDLTSLKNDVELTQRQREIENNWVSNMKKKMNDPKYLNHNFQSTIKKAFESLQIFSSNKKQLKKLFGSLSIGLVKIEHVIVAYSTILINILNLKNKTLYTNLAGKVGLSVLTQFYWSNKKSSKSYYETYNDFLVGEQIDNKKEVLLGDIFLERFIDIEMLNRVHEKGTKNVLIQINDNYISKLVDSSIISPPSLPMICKPLIWDDTHFGGYLRNEVEQRDLITGSTFKHGHKIENKSKLFTAINYFNSIKFRVNEELLLFLETDGKFLLDYLIKKEKETTNTIDAKNNKMKLVKLNIDLTLKVANFLKKIPFYLPTNADWRGRIYTSSFFLSYQGSDFSNALIQFWEGESLTKEGLDNLFIYGANSYNENDISKKSLVTRIKWVNDNYNKILEMNKDFIINAESPLVFTAFCLTLKHWNKNPQAKIYTPIFLDATCSGIQHFAGLLKDYDLGSRVNLISQVSTDNVGDIYSFILNPVNNEINKFGKENPEFSHFSNLKLNRKDIKQPTMTKLYNVTVYGMKEQLKSNFDNLKINDVNENWGVLTNYEMASSFASNFDKVYKKNNVFYKATGIDKPVLLNSKDLYQIAKIINDTIFVLFPSLKLVYEYLIGISDLLSKAKLPISWSAPSGLQITQNYLKTEVHKASIKSGNVAKTIVMRQANKEKRDNRKQKQAIIPNVIHSLDASHLINLISTAKLIDLTPIITIHDCFGTHPNKMDLVNNLILKEFISLYTKGDFLKNFHKQILKSLVDNNYEIFNTTERIQTEESENLNYTSKTRTVKYIIIDEEKIFIPNLPTEGNLDIESIINSKYFIT